METAQENCTVHPKRETINPVSHTAPSNGVFFTTYFAGKLFVFPLYVNPSCLNIASPNCVGGGNNNKKLQPVHLRKLSHNSVIPRLGTRHQVRGDRELWQDDVPAPARCWRGSALSPPASSGGGALPLL